jgi:hypothetical protein
MTRNKGALLQSMGFSFFMVLSCIVVGCGSGGGNYDIGFEGEIKGYVLDADTNYPIEGATVSADDFDFAITTSSGDYLLSLSQGYYTLTIEAPGYEKVIVADVFVQEGSTTNLDMDLTLIENRPDKPFIISPSDREMETSLRPIFETRPFIDNDNDAVHGQSHWQVSKDSAFAEENLLLSIKDKYVLTLMKPQLVLDPDTTYYLRVLHLDNQYVASFWSDTVTFTTTSDADRDGIPDLWEQTYDLDPSINDAQQDSDEDGYNNLEEYYLNEDPQRARTDLDMAERGFVQGTITESESGIPVEALIITSSGSVVKSRPDGTYFMVHEPRTFIFKIFADEYEKYVDDSVEVHDDGRTNYDVALIPIPKSPENGGTDEGGRSGGCMIRSLLNN